MIRFEEGKEYEAVCTLRFSFDQLDGAFHIVQGGYYDGEKFYVAMVRRTGDRHEFTRILVMDRDGKTLRVGPEIAVDHANNIAAVPKRGELLITHCQAPEGHYNGYSFVSPETLTVTESGELDHPFFSMGYDPVTDRYGSGEWGGETIDVWDGEMKNLASIGVEKPGSLSQGVFCDEEKIWFVRSSQRGFDPEIRVYDWEGNLLRQIPLLLEKRIEPESINIVNDEIVIVCNRPTYDGGLCYSVRLRER